MGLTIRLAVRSSYFREHELPAIHDALKGAGVATYREPTIDPERVLADAAIADVRDGLWMSFPYSFLHYLRRLAVYRRLELDAPEPIEEPDDDPVYASFYGDYFDCSQLTESHLLLHDDAAGFYVPVDFEEVIEHESLTGRWLGSSQRLLAELLDMGAWLGIEWRGEKPSEEEIARLFDEAGDELLPFFREKYVFASLYEAARLSVKFGTAIELS